MTGERVFVFDYDLLSPIGIGKMEVLQGLRNNHRGEKKITWFDASGLPAETAAPISSDLSSFFAGEPTHVRDGILYDRKLELLAAVYGLMSGRLHALFENVRPVDSGVILGLGVDVPNLENLDKKLDDLFGIEPQDRTSSDSPLGGIVEALNKNPGKLNAVLNPYDVYAIYLAEKLRLGAFQKTVLTACSASTQAIALAFRAIKNKEAQMVLAGGTDSILNSFAFMSFAKLGVLAADEDGRGNACRPFDVNRKGTMAGEAAGLCVLASERIVNQLGLSPLFELAGYGNTLDSYKITAPDPSGKGIQRALQGALAMSGISPSDIDYINLHGTGTRNNDAVELDALKSVFGEALGDIPISSTKDRHGHAIAAAGIQEFAILCLCMEHGFVPCNLNLRKPIDTENCNLIRKNLDQPVKTGMTVNFAFGGVNTVLILKQV